MLGKKSKEAKIPVDESAIDESVNSVASDNNKESRKSRRSNKKSKETDILGYTESPENNTDITSEPKKQTRKERRSNKKSENADNGAAEEKVNTEPAPEKKKHRSRRADKKSEADSAKEKNGFDVFAASESEPENGKKKKQKQTRASKKKDAKDKEHRARRRRQEGDLREEDSRTSILSGKGAGRFTLFKGKQKDKQSGPYDEDGDEKEGEQFSAIPEYDYRKDGPLVFPKHDPGDTILESYWIEPGLSRVSIVRTQDYENVYITHEPALTDFEKYLLEKLHAGVRDLLIIKEIKVENKIKTLYEAIDILLEGYKLDSEIEPATIYKIRYYLKRSFFGWGRIDPLKGDTEIEDISCDGYDSSVFIYHRKYRDMRTLIKFKEPRELDSLVALFAQKSGKHISLANPIVDATLPEGSRIQLTYGTVVGSHGSSFTIRKFKKEPYSPIDLIINGTFTVDEIVYMWMAVENNHSVLIIGGTASGKTTTLNAMAQFIPALSKVVTIEDTREINLDHENWIASVVPPSSSSLEESKHDITMFDLLKAAMRQRPEYILVGEVRGVETHTLFQAMNTGHTTFSTLHAGDVVAAINRLQNHPLDVPKATIETLDVVISQARMFRNGKQVRRCNEVVEIVGLTETGDLEINQVYTYDPDTDKPTYSGFSDIYARIAKKTNMNKADFDEEINVRKTIISSMVRQEIHDYRDVARIVWLYLSRRDFVIENIDNLMPLLKKETTAALQNGVGKSEDASDSSVENYYENLVNSGKSVEDNSVKPIIETEIIEDTPAKPDASKSNEDDIIFSWGKKSEDGAQSEKKSNSEPNAAYRFNEDTGSWDAVAPKNGDEFQIDISKPEEPEVKTEVKEEPEIEIVHEEPESEPEPSMAYRFNEETGSWDIVAPKVVEETGQEAEDEVSEEPEEIIPEEPVKEIIVEEPKQAEEIIPEEPVKEVIVEEPKPAEEIIPEEPVKEIKVEEPEQVEEIIPEEPVKEILVEEPKQAEEIISEEPVKEIIVEEPEPAEEIIPQEPVKEILVEEPKQAEEIIPEEPVKEILVEEPKQVEEIIPEEPVKEIIVEEPEPSEEIIPEKPVKEIPVEEPKQAEEIIPEEPVKEIIVEEPEPVEEIIPEKPVKEILVEEPKQAKEIIPEEPVTEIKVEEPEQVEEIIPEEPVKEIPVVKTEPAKEISYYDNPEAFEEEIPEPVKPKQPEISYYDNPEAFEEETPEPIKPEQVKVPEPVKQEETPKETKQPEKKELYFLEDDDDDELYEIESPVISDEDRFGKLPDEKEDNDIFEIGSEKKKYGSSFDLYADEPQTKTNKK